MQLYRNSKTCTPNSAYIIYILTFEVSEMQLHKNSHSSRRPPPGYSLTLLTFIHFSPRVSFLHLIQLCSIIPSHPLNFSYILTCEALFSRKALLSHLTPPPPPRNSSYFLTFEALFTYVSLSPLTPLISPTFLHLKLYSVPEALLSHSTTPP